MKRLTVLSLAALAVAAVSGFAALRTRAPAPAAAVPAAAAPAALEFAPGDLATLAPATIARTIPITGTLRAVSQAVVKAKVAGEVLEMPLREGSEVARGTVVARIDPVELRARVAEREAQLGSADAQLDQARRTFDNNQRLLERNFISQSAFDNGRAGLDVAVANRDAAAANLAIARRALADATVAAPIAGVVGERFAQPGEKVAVDGRLLSIVDLARMEIEAAVPAAEIGAVRIGQRVELQVEGMEGPVRGEIARIAPSTTAGTRSLPVFIAIGNADARLRAGLFAQGRLAVERRADVVAVPPAALRDQQGRLFVYAIEDGRIAERTVRIGVRASDAVEIVEGLRAGDRIVAVNLGALKAGAPVRETAVVPTAPAAARAPATAPPAAPATVAPAR